MFNNFPDHERFEEEVLHELDGPPHQTTVDMCLRKMRMNSMKYGRNYLNMVRRRLNDEDAILSSEVIRHNEDDMYYLKEPSLEREIERFNAFKDNNSQLLVFGFSIHLDCIEQSCIMKMELAQKYGTVDINQENDWYEWNAYIIEVCEKMNKKYPKYFCQALKATLTYVQADLLLPANSIFPSPVETITHHTEYNEMDWELIRELLHGYKLNPSCGFLFGVLNHWLIEATIGMRRQMEEFGYLICPVWAESQKPKFYPKPKETETLPQAMDNLKLSANDQGEEDERKKKFASKHPLANLPNRFNAFSKVPTPQLLEDVSNCQL